MSTGSLSSSSRCRPRISNASLQHLRKKAGQSTFTIPLPPQVGQDPKRRLHDTINSLNRKQKARLIRFQGDGSGEGVRWEFLSEEGNGNGHASSSDS